MPPIVVDRMTLYQQVWADPMVQLAKRYNVSNVTLATVCRSLQIPVPPPGYWARVRNGYKWPQPPLPKLAAGVNTTATIGPKEPVPVTPATSPIPVELIPSELFERRLHPLVRETKKHLAERAENPRLRVWEATLNIDVSDRARNRAYRLLSGLFHALEGKGITSEVVSNDHDKSKSVFVVHGEHVAFSLREQNRGRWRRNINPVPKFSFELHPDWSVKDEIGGQQKVWADGIQPLEVQLLAIVPVLLFLSPLVREKRLLSEKAAVRYRENQVRQAIEKDRQRQLATDVEAAREAHNLRELIGWVAACPATSPEEQETLSMWVEWASRIATGKDPLAEGPTSFLRRYGMPEEKPKPPS